MNVFQSILILLLLQLTACYSVKPYLWVEGEHKDTVTVTWERVNDVDKKCRALPIKDTAKTILGCSYKGADTCIIYSPLPKEVDDNKTTTAGHELAHCFNFSHKEM